PRKGLHISVSHAHAATGQKIISGKLMVLDDGDESQAIGEDINVVDRRDGESDLEFARQIRLSVKRISEVSGSFVLQFELLAFDPDLVVRLGLWEKGIRDAACIRLDLIHQFTGCRRWRSSH